MIPQVDPIAIKKSIDSKEDVILLDVRTPNELTRGKLDGCVNVPVDEIEEKITAVIPDKNKKIYVYCLSGTRSDKAVEIMKRLGYTNVSSMTHGLLMWRIKKYPIV